MWLRWAGKESDAGRKLSAVMVLINGLAHTSRAPELVDAIEQLGVRRGPVLRFLPRSHAVNRFLGRTRHRLLGPVKLQRAGWAA